MQNGIRIMNLEGADLLRTNVEDKFLKEKWEAVFPISKLSKKLDAELTIKEFKSKDIINVKFNMPVTNIDSNKYSIHGEYITQDNKSGKDKISADDIRKILYKEGFSLIFKKDRVMKSSRKERTKIITDIENNKYILVNADGEVMEEESFEYETIEYVFWFRTSAKARIGEALFINKKLYKDIYKWQCMNIELLTDKESMVVELMAYMALTASSIEDEITIDPDTILVIDDLQSRRLTNCAKVVVNSAGECGVNTEKDYVINTIFDGQALMDDSLFGGSAAGMKLLRHHFFKACAFRTNIELFMRDYCNENGLDYNTYTVKDRYGNDIKVKDIKLITTENAMKWEKFFKDRAEGYRKWKEVVREDNNLFGVCKEDHESKFGDKQKMSYQMLNTLPVTKDELKNIANHSINYINTLKNTDNEEFITYLEDNKSIMTPNEMMVDLLKLNKNFGKTELFKDFKSDTICKLKKNLRKGKLMVEGDNLTVVGNPYLMLLHSVDKVEVDKNGFVSTADVTLLKSEDYISVYTKRFNADEELAAFRNPHNSLNNIALFKNNRNELLEKYFKFSKNIMAVNYIDTELQDLANGMDQDSDFMFTTSDKNIVSVVKDKVFRKYACIVNCIEQSKKKYINTLENKAIIDNALAKGKNDIGTSSNQAQIAMSLFANSNYEDNELLNKVIILSVLAQVAIDNAKRQYEVDLLQEIRRLTTKGKRPLFFYYTSKNKETEYKVFDKDSNCKGTYKNKYQAETIAKDMAGEVKVKNVKKSKSSYDNTIKCTMNDLQEIINKDIKNASKIKGDTEDIFLIIPTKKGKAKYEQCEKIGQMVEEYNNRVVEFNSSCDGLSDEETRDKKINFRHEEEYLVEQIINKIQKMSMTDKTINSLILSTLKKDSKNSNTHIRLKLLNILYKSKKQQFLDQFENDYIIADKINKPSNKSKLKKNN